MGKGRKKKLKWAKSLKKKPILRKPVPPPGKSHKSKKDYDRKEGKNIDIGE